MEWKEPYDFLTEEQSKRMHIDRNDFSSECLMLESFIFQFIPESNTRVFVHINKEIRDESHIFTKFNYRIRKENESKPESFECYIVLRPAIDGETNYYLSERNENTELGNVICDYINDRLDWDTNEPDDIEE